MKIIWKNWHHNFNRPLTLNQAQGYSWSCFRPLTKILGRGLKNQLYVIQGDSADGYFLKQEWQEFNEFIYHKCFLNRQFLKGSNRAVFRGALKLENFFKKYDQLDLTSLSRSAILKLFKKTVKVLTNDIAYLWVGFLLETSAEKKILEIIAKYDLPVEETIATLSSFDRANHLAREKIDLLKIASQSGDQSKYLKAHHLKYQYIPCYSVEVSPLTIGYFKKRLQTLKKKTARLEISRLKDRFRENGRNFRKLLDETDFSELDRLFVTYFYEFNFMKDYRSHFRSLAYYYLRQLFQEISKRYKLSIVEISSLLDQEIEILLASPSVPPKISQILKARSKRDSLYLFRGGREAVFKNQLVGLEKVHCEVKGFSAYPGKARGKVKIVLNPNNVNLVQKGNILLSPMTRPDFVPAMKKAAAIVTNEGGALCHAAIVARELKKPCIVGTKIATKIFKDGDLVEVDANQGTIKLITRSK